MVQDSGDQKIYVFKTMPYRNKLSDFELKVLNAIKEQENGQASTKDIVRHFNIDAYDFKVKDSSLKSRMDAVKHTWQLTQLLAKLVSAMTKLREDGCIAVRPLEK